MEFAFFYIVAGLALGVITIMNQLGSNHRRRCDELGVRHVWVTKDPDTDSSYLVCEKCHILLSGLKEEEDNSRDFGDDF